MTWGYVVLGLRIAALCAFVPLVLARPPGGEPGLCLPAAAVRVMLWAAAYLFVLPGGTALVRHVLDAANPAWCDQGPLVASEQAPRPMPQPLPGAVPAPCGEALSDVRAEIAATNDGDRVASRATELRQGRIIGNVERLIVITLVCLGQYGAIGLVLAAKSLARFPQLSDSRDFAEYYLIGTLVSMAVAIGTGLLLASALARV